MNCNAQEVLVGLVVDLAFYFEFSDDEALDSDLAVELLETLSSHLKKMDGAERKSFSDLIRKQAEKYVDIERSDFILNLPETLGLV